MSAVLGVTPGRIAQQMGALQDGWAAHAACRELLDTVAETARQALADLGGVATIDELAGAVLAALPPAAGSPAPAARIAAGLLRLALDRAEALNRADASDERFVPRRRGGRIALLATDPALLDPAEALGRAADHLVAEARAAEEPLVPGARAATRLQDIWSRAVAEPESPAVALSAGRLLRLATALAQDACLAGSGDLYRRDLPATEALAIALSGVGGVQSVTAAGDPRPGPGQVPRAVAAARSPSPGPARGRGRAEPGVRRRRACLPFSHPRGGHYGAGLTARHVQHHSQSAARGRWASRAAPDRKREHTVVPRARRGRRPNRPRHRRA